MIWLEELQTRKKLSRIFSVYEKTFPKDERREEDQFLSLIENPNCYMYSVKKEDDSVGYLILWRCSDFYFLEHFEVFEEFRNLKLGSEILSVLKVKFGNIILESEPDTFNEIAERRIKFYLRNGFSIVAKNYIQPSYGAGKNAISLFLLSNSNITEISTVINEIHQTVYNCY